MSGFATRTRRGDWRGRNPRSRWRGAHPVQGWDRALGQSARESRNIYGVQGKPNGGDSVEQQLGRYILQKVIGKGSVGIVYLAHDTFTATAVAVKVVDSDMLADPDTGPVKRKLFLKEASLVGKLSHPHIVAIIDAAIQDPPFYIAMEYIAGGSLAELMRDNPRFPLPDTTEIAFKCCSALDYMSRYGIVHRDIKPANIMRVEGTEVKIADFGAAYFRHANETQVTTVGTPAYESPEQVLGKALTHQSDMFSLAVVFYELLAGQRPFVAKNLTDLFRQIVKDDPVPPSKVEPTLPARFDDVVLRALSKNPEDRYATWADFALAVADAGRLSVFEQSIPHSQRYQALRALPTLRHFSDVEIWELVKAGSWRRMPARSVLVAEGEAGHTVFLLAQGDAKVTIQGRLLNVLKHGDCFGEMAFVRSGSAPRQVTVEATSDVLVVEFEPQSLNEVSTGCQLRFAQVLLHALSDRLALADTRILQLSR
jgi:serine/threonine protein kinase